MNWIQEIHDAYNADRDRFEHLHQDHEALERRLVDLHVRARNGDWRDLDQVWADFVRDLESHMAFEEGDLFGRFAQGRPEQDAYVAQLCREHAEIRRAIERLGIEIQLHVIRAETVDALLDALRRHARSEEQVFYPWLEEALL